MRYSKEEFTTGWFNPVFSLPVPIKSRPRLREQRMQDIKALMGLAESSMAGSLSSSPGTAADFLSHRHSQDGAAVFKERGMRVDFEAFSRDPAALRAYWQAQKLLQEFDEDEYFKKCYPL